MKTLNEYLINEECKKIVLGDELITEGLFKKIKSWFKKMFSLSDTDDEMNIEDVPDPLSQSDYYSHKNEVQRAFNTKNLSRMMGPVTRSYVEGIVKASGPDKVNKRGFWEFKELLNSSEFSSSEQLALDTEFYVWTYITSKFNDICGVVALVDQLKEGKFKEHIQILKILTDSLYSGHHLMKTYLKDIEEYAKKKNYRGIIIKAEHKFFRKVLSGYGFLPDSFNTDSKIMYKNFYSV